MATAKKKTAINNVAVPSKLPTAASMTKPYGAVFTDADRAELASAIGTPPSRAAWYLNEDTNTLTAFHVSLFTH